MAMDFNYYTSTIVTVLLLAFVSVHLLLHSSRGDWAMTILWVCITPTVMVVWYFSPRFADCLMIVSILLVVWSWKPQAFGSISAVRIELRRRRRIGFWGVS